MCLISANPRWGHSGIAVIMFDRFGDISVDGYVIEVQRQELNSSTPLM